MDLKTGPIFDIVLAYQRYLPQILVGLTVILIMVGAYASVGMASSASPKALWSTSPASIKFSGSAGTASSGSVADSFKCAPPVSSSVSLRTSVSNPTKITLTLSRSSFPSCGPSFTTVTLTAHCLVSTCEGSYSGTVTVFKDQYTTVPPGLQVNIVAT